MEEPSSLPAGLQPGPEQQVPPGDGGGCPFGLHFFRCMEKTHAENSHVNTLPGNSFQLVPLTFETTLTKALAESQKSGRTWQRNWQRAEQWVLMGGSSSQNRPNSLSSSFTPSSSFASAQAFQHPMSLLLVAEQGLPHFINAFIHPHSSEQNTAFLPGL